MKHLALALLGLLCAFPARAAWGPLEFNDPIFDDPNELGAADLEIDTWDIYEDFSITAFHTINGANITIDNVDPIFHRLRSSARDDLFRLNGYYAQVTLVDSYVRTYGSKNGDMDCGASAPNLCDHADNIQAMSTYSGLVALRTTFDCTHPDPNDPNAIPGHGPFFREDGSNPLYIDLEDVVLNECVMQIVTDEPIYFSLRLVNVCIVDEDEEEWIVLRQWGGVHWDVYEYENVNFCTIEEGEIVVGDPIDCEEWIDNPDEDTELYGSVSCPE